MIIVKDDLWSRIKNSWKENPVEFIFLAGIAIFVIYAIFLSGTLPADPSCHDGYC